MKVFTIFLSLMLLGAVGCAHNPRPESPEQRAERQAQSFQEQQDARSQPYTSPSRRQQSAAQDRDEQPESQSQDSQTSAAEARRQAEIARDTLRSTRESMATGMTGVTGGLLR